MARCEPALVVAPRAADRLAAALSWLNRHGRDDELVVVGHTSDAVTELVRRAADDHPAIFGWHRLTLPVLAWRLAAVSISTSGRALAGGLAREALCARVIDRACREGLLSSYEVIADRPGFSRALARTLSELAMAGLEPGDLADGSVAELGVLYRLYRDELASCGLVDRADVFAEAARMICSGQDDDAIVGRPTLLLDVPLRSRLERELVGALAVRAPTLLATVPYGDGRSQRGFEIATGVEAELRPVVGTGALARLQRHLFGGSPETLPLDDRVRLLSTPGESRECVEIVRAVLAQAEAGVTFDRMAVLLRNPEPYADHLVEAFERGRVPAYFSRGTVRPDRSGRALLALLACKADNLSASRFAEYLSLAVVPEPDAEGAPPAAAASGDGWQPPEHDMAALAAAVVPAVEPTPAAGDVALGAGLRFPRRWEQLLVDAAVIGNDRGRWARRLAGLRRQIQNEHDQLLVDAPKREALDHRLRQLDALERFALPLIDALAALPAEGTWGVWIEALSSLATRALRRPQRVLEVLTELAPMAQVSPVTLDDVMLLLGRKLAELVVRPETARAGKVLVASAEEARGMSFDVVFVPGLAEKMFPKKVAEDPLALDALRSDLSVDLEDNAARVETERLSLRMAIGAATKRVMLSYPRIDVERSRPRVPSFYGLEVLRAAEGTLPGFDELARRAESGAAERMGWPAPADAADAIDESEYDLALLDQLLRLPRAQTKGAARYLLNANVHLARALRFRARRWKMGSWTRADGLVRPEPSAKAALAEHALAARAYSPTALQQFAACPYRFYLSAILGLSARRDVAAVEELDALQRGRLVHEVQLRVLRDLQRRGELPLSPDVLATAQRRSDALLDEVASALSEQLAPAIDRVWNDAVEEIRGDLRQWLAQQAADPSWVPQHFELAFGLRASQETDAASITDPVMLGCGVSLRGAVDLVERRGDMLRATDHKTGRAWVTEGVIGGGRSLQPVLYAMALERLFPDRTIVGGRLYYCTTRGGFGDHLVPLDERARGAAARMMSAIGGAIDAGHLPAAPAEGACDRCDYISICGPREAQRTARKPPLVMLRRLREEP